MLPGRACCRDYEKKQRRQQQHKARTAGRSELLRELAHEIQDAPQEVSTGAVAAAKHLSQDVMRGLHPHRSSRACQTAVQRCCLPCCAGWYV